MLPISKERLEWIAQRRAVLDQMVRELTARQARYLANPRYGANHTIVMDEIVREDLKLFIEQNCLTEHFTALDAARFAEEVQRMDNALDVALKANGG